MATRRKITEQLREQTKEAHGHLNRRIIPLLSHGLPPTVESPARYVDDMMRILPLYSVMETAMAEFESKPKPQDPMLPTPPKTPYNSPASDYLNVVPPISAQLEAVGSQTPPMPTIDASGLLSRAQALQSDLSNLASGFSLSQPSYTEPSPSTLARLRSEPHRLLAWRYVLYNALFNGGRWIRRQLEQAFLIGWFAERNDGLTLQSIKDIRRRFLSFWFFEDEEDVDFKGVLKARLDEEGGELSEAETADVLREAAWLFTEVERIVDGIDDAK